jgi:hypothetical protein
MFSKGICNGNCSKFLSVKFSKQHSEFIGADGKQSTVTFEVPLDMAYDGT